MDTLLPLQDRGEQHNGRRRMNEVIHGDEQRTRNVQTELAKLFPHVLVEAMGKSRAESGGDADAVNE